MRKKEYPDRLIQLLEKYTSGDYKRIIENNKEACDYIIQAIRQEEKTSDDIIRVEFGSREGQEYKAGDIIEWNLRSATRDMDFANKVYRSQLPTT